MDKSPDAFRTISEAAEELNLPQHVLRFWETRFSSIKPLKRGGGRRYYRPEDVLLLKGIRHLLYDRGFTIKGVQRILKDQGVRFVIGVGQGNSAGELVRQVADDDSDSAATEEHRDAGQAADRPANASLAPEDRNRLSEVLRELLESKRLLDRAREG